MAKVLDWDVVRGWPLVAEAWRPDLQWHTDGCLDLWFGDDSDPDELAILELGDRVDLWRIEENCGPDYRQWERVDSIASRARRATG